jgi:glycosyltransferase involved in cell wall biosynthesis
LIKPCILIPFYDHGHAIPQVLEEVDAVRQGMSAIVIDDGSANEHQAALTAAASLHPWVRIETRARNGGKGAALKAGYRAAQAAGFSHAVQIDADGQHDAGTLPALLDASQRHPEALILAVPHFENAPIARQLGRHISTFWVWVETGTRAIKDPLCGLRSLPLAPTVAILDRTECGDAMDFDPEIAVRLVWDGVPIQNVPTTVNYPHDGTSHFRMLQDNVLITRAHTRLVVSMLLRRISAQFNRAWPTP